MHIRTFLKPLSFIPAILLMYMIYSFSAQDGATSSDLSHRFSYSVVSGADYVLDLELSEEQKNHYADRIELPARKLAHMTEYFLLAIAVSFPLYVYGLHGILLVLTAGMICVSYAGLDEYHQSFVSGRSPQVKDVGIDSIGILVGILIVRIIGWTGRHTIFRPADEGKMSKKELKKMQKQQEKMQRQQDRQAQTAQQGQFQQGQFQQKSFRQGQSEQGQGAAYGQMADPGSQPYGTTQPPYPGQFYGPSQQSYQSYHGRPSTGSQQPYHGQPSTGPQQPYQGQPSTGPQQPFQGQPSTGPQQPFQGQFFGSPQQPYQGQPYNSQPQHPFNEQPPYTDQVPDEDTADELSDDMKLSHVFRHAKRNDHPQ